MKKIINLKKKSDINIKELIITYLVIVIGSLIKPYKTIKKERKSFEDIKITSIFVLILSIIITIINVIIKMFDYVKFDNYDWYTGQTVELTDWSLLKNFPFFKEFFLTLILSFMLIVLISSLYYIMGTLFNKKLNIGKLMGITGLCLFQTAILNYTIVKLISLISTSISTIALIIIGVHYMIVLYELLNEEIELPNSKKVVANTTVIGILLSIIYLVVYIIK